MKLKQSMLLLFIIILISLRCDTTEPPPSKANLTLTLEDVSCTEAWLTLKTTDIQLPISVTLKQNDQARMTINLTKSDTLFYIDSLLPRQAYKFQSVIQPFNQSEVKSNELNVTTMDTTSHNFTWQTFTFGQHSSSTLYDIAIINENNIWAVGEIYMNDSLGNPDSKRYNLVVWDGNEWKVKRIPYNYQGSVFYHPIQSIFAFNNTDIWFCGNGVIRWNGQQFIEVPIPTSVWGAFQMNKLWGSSSNDLYVVGNGGNIAHYQNGVWTKIESGTDLQYLDAYGDFNVKTGKQEVLAVCTRNYPLNKAIYKIEGNTASQISSAPIQWELLACWFIPNRHYYVVGSGIYEKKFLTDSSWKNGPLDITRYGTSGIRGNNLNNIFVSGAFGEFLHYNGVSWKSYIDELGKFNGSYGGLSLKGSLVATVGYEVRKAKLLIGKN